MDGMKLGIVGGCLATTGHVKLSDLYFRRLAHRLRDRGMSLHVALAGYSDPDELVREVRRLAGKKKASVVLLQLRPLPLVRNGWLLWWRTDQAGRPRRLALHPAFFNRDSKSYDTSRFSYGDAHDRWRQAPHEAEPDRPAPSLWRRWLLKGNLNSFVGRMCGLHRWALGHQLLVIEQARKACDETGVSLVVLGPVSIPIYPAGDAVCRWHSRRLAFALAAAGVTFVDAWGSSNPEGQALFHRDAQHVNALGHVQLANLLEPVVAAALADRAVRSEQSIDEHAGEEH